MLITKAMITEVQQFCTQLTLESYKKQLLSYFNALQITYSKQ
jgi:hypothetical protein